MKVVGIENMICDYYFWKDKVYINGGGTVSNILVNLDANQIPCKLIGYCGNDQQGTWILNSLKKTKIDLIDVNISNTRTKSFYIQKNKTTSLCPFCHTKKKRYPLLSIENILPHLNIDDYILIKDYSKLNEKIIEKGKNEIFLDLSTIKPFLYMSQENIKKYIFHSFKIINISEQAFHFLQKKLNQTHQELLENMNSEIIIITKGKKGVEFFYHHNNYIFDIKDPWEEIETNGCGDMFLSNVIIEYLSHPNREWTTFDFQNLFQKCQKKVQIVLKNIGARNHIIPNQLIKQTNNCICDTFILL